MSPARSKPPYSAPEASRLTTPERTIGEFAELSSGYSGGYKPARVNLSKALQAGKLRNPLGMQQKTPLWTSGSAQIRGNTAPGGDHYSEGGGGGAGTPHSPSRPPSRPGSRGRMGGTTKR